jgi:sulfur-oxidizing protein SoxY
MTSAFLRTPLEKLMNEVRRNLLRQSVNLSLLAVAAGAGLLKPTRVLAASWNDAGFAATKPADALSAIGGGAATASADIAVKAPDIAENGAVVPVEISTTLPNIESIAILGEKNTNPLVAIYEVRDFDGQLSTRIKLGQTANVRVVVKAGGKTYTAAKEVKVTVGGCGG